jgi:hypothetical protein
MVHYQWSNKMKKFITLIILLAMSSIYAGNNDIYITQTGTGLTLTIDQIGATNKVGTTSARAIVSGTSMTLDIDQIASILQGNNTSWTYRNTGDSGSATFAVGATGDVAGSDFDWASSGGDGNILVFTQGADATATSGDQDFSITGASNNLNVKCEVIGCTNNWTISGSSNDIDTVQSGANDHDITVNLTGSSMDVDIHQTDTASTNVANLLLQSSGGSGSSVDIDQCASGC